MPHEAAATRFQGVYMFKDRVQSFLPSAKTIVVGRFLPSFNWTIPMEDPAFATGWLPYRDKASAHPKTGLPVFTRWSVALDVFDGMGPEGRDTIISNNSRIALCGAQDVSPADRLDALGDVHRVAQNHAKTDPTIKAMLETERANARPIIPRSATKVLFNIMGVRDRQWAVGPMPMSYSGFTELSRLADLFPNPIEPVLDPEWPYMYGDFTAPATGLQFQTCQVPAANKRPFNSVQFSTKPNSVEGVTRCPVPDSVLAQRINLWDPAIYNWFTYQEQVDYLVNSTQVPMHLIQEACSMRASIPERKGAVVYSQPGHQQPSLPGLPSAPTGYQPQAAPAGYPAPPATGYPAPPQAAPAGYPAPPAAGYPASPQAGYPAPPQVPITPGAVNPATFASPPGYQPPQDYIPGVPGDPNLQAGPVPEQSMLAQAASVAAAPPPPPVFPGGTTAPPMAAQVPPPMVAPSPAAATVPPPPPPPPAAPTPALPFPPEGWLAHPSAPGFFYCGEDVKSEVDLRAMMAPAAPPAPPAPLPPAPPQQAVPAPLSPAPAQGPTLVHQRDILPTTGPQTKVEDWSAEVVQAKLGADAAEFFRLVELSRAGAGIGMSAQDIERFLALTAVLSQ